MPHRSSCLLFLAFAGLLLAAAGAVAAQQPPLPAKAGAERGPDGSGPGDEAGPRYYLYDDKQADFIPAGWMPDGRGLKQDVQCDDAPHGGKCCVRCRYSPAENSWAGIGWELDGQWSPNRKLNLFERLEAKPGDRVVLRWWARSPDKARVRFIAGGGQGDSIAKPAATRPEWTELGPQWARYELDLTGRELGGVVQGFAWFMERDRSPPGADAVQMDLDDIYFVKLRGGKPGAAPAVPPAQFDAARRRFHRKLADLRWVDYSPSTFDSQSDKPVPPAVIEEDFKVLAAQGFPPARTGICTYGCSPRFGIEKVPEIARKLGFAGMILGVWSVDPESDEMPVARELARAGLIDAVCVGNEGLHFGRYSEARLQSAVRRMRIDTGLPVSTSEVVEQYGRAFLTDPEAVDWVYPNVHPVFHNYSDPRKAAQWVGQTLDKLARRTRLPVLVHETGWPSHGLAHHTEAKQREFWDCVLKSGHRFAVFEAYDQAAKHEEYQGVDIGTSWGWFTSDRRPKAVVETVRDGGRAEEGRSRQTGPDNKRGGSRE